MITDDEEEFEVRIDPFTLGRSDCRELRKRMDCREDPENCSSDKAPSILIEGMPGAVPTGVAELCKARLVGSGPGADGSLASR